MNKEYVENVCSEEFMEFVREKLNLRKIDLPNRKIMAITRFHNEKIADWVVDNGDGFKFGNLKAGTLVVTKYMPLAFKYCDPEEIDQVKTWDWKKELLKKKFAKKLANHPNGKKRKAMLESFFYEYTITWYNRKNHDFKKCPFYKFRASKSFRSKLVAKLEAGKDYFEWKYYDFKEKFTVQDRKNFKKKK